MLYQHQWQQHETHLQKDCRAYVKLLFYYMGYGQQERLKDIVEKEAEEEEQPAAAREEEDWRNNPWVLRFMPDHLKTQEICIKVFEADL